MNPVAKATTATTATTVTTVTTPTTLNPFAQVDRKNVKYPTTSVHVSHNHFIASGIYMNGRATLAVSLQGTQLGLVKVRSLDEKIIKGTMTKFINSISVDISDKVNQLISANNLFEQNTLVNGVIRLVDFPKYKVAMIVVDNELISLVPAYSQNVDYIAKLVFKKLQDLDILI